MEMAKKVRVELFIVTFQRDFNYLQYCLNSYVKFAKGFERMKILVPVEDYNAANALVSETIRGKSDVCVMNAEEWPGQGFLWHMAQIMKADEWCPTADFIAHIDPDCIFTEPVTPEDYVKDGKPILRYEYFSSICQRHPVYGSWQECTQRCLPFLVTAETMRCHPGVHHRRTYAEARAQIEKKTGTTCDDYIKSQRQEFPQGFCEFVTLGNVALHCFPNHYVAVEQTGDRMNPPNKLQQFWSHRPLDQVQNIWVNGEQRDVVPLRMIEEVLK